MIRATVLSCVQNPPVEVEGEQMHGGWTLHLRACHGFATGTKRWVLITERPYRTGDVLGLDYTATNERRPATLPAGLLPAVLLANDTRSEIAFRFIRKRKETD